MTEVYVFDRDGLRRAATPASRPLRWAAWRPDGSWALAIGNRGEALRFDGAAFQRLPTGVAHNLRGVDWSPDGALALLAGNRGAVLLYNGARFEELPAVTTENLRRVAFSPSGECALVIGNGGAVLRFDTAARALYPLPGDRAHTMRSVGWRPDGAYALIGAYASRYAGYPRPHVLYRCDGRYTQSLLATDVEDDAVALSWRPGVDPAAALALVVSYGAGPDTVSANKIFTYDGAGFATQPIEAPAALLGAAWSPDGTQALICGEHGAMFRYDGMGIEAIPSGTRDNLVGPFWHPSNGTALFLKGPDEKVYTV